MPKRTQLFQQIPWTGGLNSSVDPGVLPVSDLVTANNVVFASTSARVKREGFSYFDALSHIPAVTHRASSGTTRTLTFASDLDATAKILVAGEGIIVSASPTAGVTETTYYTIDPVNITSISGNTITYTGSGSLPESTTATSTLTVTRKYAYVEVVDYWRYASSNTQTQSIIAITEQPKIFAFDTAGNRTEVEADGTATARVGTALKSNSVVFNDRLIIGQTRLGNTPIKYDPDSDLQWLNLGGTPPDFSIVAVHLNRLWTNNKANPHRLEYSATGNHEEWGGVGDSGALDIKPGDGDPSGLTAIFSFRGRLLVAKKNRLYQIVGDSPENFQIVEVSNAVGCVNHAAIAYIDQDDAIFTSNKGVHSVSTTNSYGDFANSYLSLKVQPDFNALQKNRLEYTQAVYVEGLNSIVFAVSEDNTTKADSLWLFNTALKEWYKWPEVDAQSLGIVQLENEQKLLIGTSDGKLIEAQNGEYTDFDTTGIRYRIKSGTIYPDSNPFSVKAFKRLTLYYRPFGTYSFTARFKIDNYSEQVLAFNQTSSGDELDTTFVLGSSLLGLTSAFAPFTQPIDGMGRGFTLEIEQSGTDQQVSIYGFAVEFESADNAQETLLEPESI